MAQVSCSSGTLSIVQDSTRERSTTHTLHLSAHEPDHEPYIDEVQTLVAKFLNEINYQRPSNIQNDVLYNAMLKRARATGVELSSPMSRRCFDVGHTYAAVCLPDLALEVQVYVGIFTWLTTQIDDIPNLDDVADFQQRFFSGQTQPNPVLAALADLLRSTYEQWDKVIADFIIVSTCQFVTCNGLEERPEFQRMGPSKGGDSWPYYFRSKEGAPEAYAFFTFPKATAPDIGLFLEVIPDMCRVLNLGNDILSFYKEEKAGVTKNYLHQRANYEGRDVMSVFKDVTTECVEHQKRIETVLQGREPYLQTWLNHINGYIHFHRTTTRYRLNEIGLSEEKCYKIDPDAMDVALGDAAGGE